MASQIVICANLLPIGTYLCVLGLFHATGRPFIATGGRDYLALAVALSGLMITGPIDYILHGRMLPDFLLHSHLFGIVLYALVALSFVPRRFEKLVVYNCPASTFAQAMRAMLERGGHRFQEVQGGWILPERGVSLECDSFEGLRNVTLYFHGMRDHELFKEIHRGLLDLLASRRTGWSLAGMSMAAAGGLILAFPVWIVANDPQNIVAAIRNVLETW